MGGKTKVHPQWGEEAAPGYHLHRGVWKAFPGSAYFALRRILVITSNVLKSIITWSQFPPYPCWGSQDRQWEPRAAAGSRIYSDLHCRRQPGGCSELKPAEKDWRRSVFLIPAIFWHLGNSLGDTGRLSFLYALSVQYVFKSWTL